MSYQVFFNLDDAPFRMVPDPDYYFPSKRHSEALETLIYCVESGEGFVQITGEPGVGKTLLIRSFLDQLGDDVNTALILHPRLEAEELFKVILEDLGLAPENMEGMSKEALLRSFRDILLESAQKGVRTIVIIDEAQEIPETTLEELRLLSNLETEKTKLLQIVLVGQRELEETLGQDSLKQLQQRITIRYRLDTLTLDETINYIQHRLKVAGGGNISRFSHDIIKRIHESSNGVPRIINTLCERSLMAAFVDGKSSVNQDHLLNAIQSLEYNADSNQTVTSNRKRSRVIYLFLAASLVSIALYYSHAPFQKLINLKTNELVSFLQAQKTKFTLPPTIDTVEKTIKETPSIVATPQTETSDQAGSAEDVGHDTVVDITGMDTVAVDTPLSDISEPSVTAATASERVDKSSQSEIAPGQEAPLQENERRNPEEPDPDVQENVEDSEEYAYATVVPAETTSAMAQDVVGHSPPVTEDPSIRVTDTKNNIGPVDNQQAIGKGTKSFVSLPPGWQSITVQQQKKALLFQSNNPVPIKELALPQGISLENGIYLLGQEKDRPFLFNHRSFFAWQGDPSLTDWFWRQFIDDQSPPVIPVIVVSSTEDDQLTEQSEVTTVQAMVRKWARAYDQKNLEELMQYYDDSLVSYQLFRNRPSVQSHAEIAANKSIVFKKNKALSLQITEPACIVNSEDSSQAIAFFYQRFISSSYRDTGIKVLYLRKTDSNTSASPPWVITGRLWLPVQDNITKSTD